MRERQAPAPSYPGSGLPGSYWPITLDVTVIYWKNRKHCSLNLVKSHFESKVRLQ